MVEHFCNTILTLLLDSLWVAGFFWIFLSILIKVIPSRFALYNYYVAIIFFFGFVVVLLVSSLMGTSIYDGLIKPKILVVANDFESHQYSFNFLEKVRLFVLGNNSTLMVFWYAGVLLFGAKIFFEVRQMAEIKRSSFLDNNLTALNQKLLKRLNLSKPVKVVLSAKVSQPFTIGYVKPIVYFPVQALTGFSGEVLEMVLLHELIHIKRNDYLINFIQLWIEALFFFNPFVWLMSRIVRNERESSCDYLVVKNGYQIIDYAKALQASYELHSNLAVSFGNRNVFSRINLLARSNVPQVAEKKASSFIILGLGLIFAFISLGFGVAAKNATNVKTITKVTKVYPWIEVSNDQDITFHFDSHRAWQFCNNGEQAFYKDGQLRNDELAANFEYKEIDRGDHIELLYYDKLRDRSIKGRRTKNLNEWQLFVDEIFKELELSSEDQEKESVLFTKLRTTPFGGWYFSGKKLSDEIVERYTCKYPLAIDILTLRHSEENLQFLQEMVHELQSDGLVSKDPDSVQVVFQFLKKDNLILNGKELSEGMSKKYVIYLNELNNGFLYEGHSYYLK